MTTVFKLKSRVKAVSDFKSLKPFQSNLGKNHQIDG
jgi:hypothetical protein